MRLSSPAIVGVPTLFAHVTLFPFYFRQVIITGLFIRKPFVENNGVYSHEPISFIHATKVASCFY
jgi:hypothetical protein